MERRSVCMIRRGYSDGGQIMIYDGGLYVNRSVEEHKESIRQYVARIQWIPISRCLVTESDGDVTRWES